MLGRAMRVLRLTNSDDTNPSIPAQDRSPAITGHRFSELTGEPCETIARVIWPRSSLPGLIDRWVQEYRPDLVFLVVTSFWFTYESLPLKVERSLGPLGRPVARAGIKAGGYRPLATSRAFHAGRRFALRTIGGATHFSPPQVVSCMEACIRTVLAHEDVVLVVRGPQTAFSSDAGPRVAARAKQRWWQVERDLQQLCHQLHVEYISFGTPAIADGSSSGYQRDFVHLDSAGHRRRAEIEAAAMATAWRRSRGQPD
jgi:hypothetical protein